MNDILKFLGLILIWGIVPVPMIALIIFGKKVVKKANEHNMKISANAGWWAGLILFVFVFIYHLKDITIPQLSGGIDFSKSIPGGIVGTFIGFGSIWILKPLIQNRAVGILTLIFSSSGSIALFSYIFIRNINHLLLSGVLGIAFGTLVHIVVFPENSHNLFSD